MTHHDNAAEHEDETTTEHTDHTDTDQGSRDEVAPGSAAENIADAENNSGTQRPAPDIEEADRAASEQSRRLAAEQDTEL